MSGGNLTNHWSLRHNFIIPISLQPDGKDSFNFKGSNNTFLEVNLITFEIVKVQIFTFLLNNLDIIV